MEWPLAETQMPLPCNRNRILLVDDEDSIRRLFRVILSSSLPDCSVDLASNGLEAVQSFSKDHHSLLLMDLHMPIMDGQMAFNEIAALCALRDWQMPSVVFCTGFAPPDSVIEVVQSNQDHGLLLKPVSTDILIEAISSRLRRGTES